MNLDPLAWRDKVLTSADPEQTRSRLSSLSGQVQAMRTPLQDWLASGQEFAAQQAAETVEHLQRPLLVGLGLLDQLAESLDTGRIRPSETTNPLSWRPIHLAKLLDVLTDQPGDRSILGALLVYTRFLGDTGRWASATSDQRFSVELLEAELLDGQPGEPPLAPGSDEELLTLTETHAVEQVASLLRWIGDGKSLSSSGNLSLRDVVVASAELGEAVATTKKAAGPGDLVVRSMWQAPALSLAWVAASAAGLTEQVGNQVRLTEAGHDLVSLDPPSEQSPPELRQQAMRQAVSAYVVALLEANPVDGETDAGLLDALVMGLVRAVTGNPVEITSVAASLIALGGDAKDLEAELAVWADLDLVILDDGLFEVPLGLWPGVAAGLLAYGVDNDSLPLPTQA